MQLNLIKVWMFFMLAVLGGHLFYSVRTGEMRMQGGCNHFRHERPVLFWLLAGLNCWGVVVPAGLLIYLLTWIGR